MIRISEKTKKAIAERMSKRIAEKRSEIYEMINVAKFIGVADDLSIKLSDSEFKKVLNRLTDHDDSQTDHYGIELESNVYSIGIYAEESDNFEMIIDEALVKIADNWVNIEFTDEQNIKLENRLYKCFQNLEEEKEYNRWLDAFDNEPEPDFHTHKY